MFGQVRLFPMAHSSTGQAVDESLLTGEPAPAEKKKGDEVIAETKNGRGSFVFLAEKLVLKHFCPELLPRWFAQRSKVLSKEWLMLRQTNSTDCVSYLARYIHWMVFSALNLGPHAIVSSVCFVIACPCAIILATPMSIIVGIGSPARASCSKMPNLLKYHQSKSLMTIKQARSLKDSLRLHINIQQTFRRRTFTAGNCY